MQRGASFVSLTLAATFALVACSTSPELSFEDGWEWGLRSSASFALGADFNYLTGEIDLPEADGGTGLSLPSTASAEPNEREQALADAERSACAQYVDPFGDDKLESQGYDILFLMYDTVRATMAREYSDEYVAAYEAVNDWVDRNGPDLTDIEYGSDAYEEATNERSQLWDAQWEEKYADLESERESMADLSRALNLEVFTSENVRAAQEYFIERCGIEVSEGYKYPSPDELGITVDDEYAATFE